MNDVFSNFHRISISDFHYFNALDCTMSKLFKNPNFPIDETVEERAARLRPVMMFLGRVMARLRKKKEIERYEAAKMPLPSPPEPPEPVLVVSECQIYFMDAAMI